MRCRVLIVAWYAHACSQIHVKHVGELSWAARGQIYMALECWNLLRHLAGLPDSSHVAVHMMCITPAGLRSTTAGSLPSKVNMREMQILHFCNVSTHWQYKYNQWHVMSSASNAEYTRKGI